MSLPYDGATTRLHKLNHLVEYCSTFGTKGCTEAQLIKEGLTLGNTNAKILEYISVIHSILGLLTRRASRFYVEERNYREWAEAKGFRDRTYNIECKECEAQYNSILAECPTCHTSTKDNLNEVRRYTHIPLDENLELDSELTTDQDTHIHTHESTPRPERVKKGREAEKKAITFLSKFGEASLGKGRDGEPDVFFTSKRAGYAVEVKSINHRTGSKPSCVSLSVGQWTRLVTFSGLNDLVPLLLVAVRVRGSNKGSLYHFMPRLVVNDLLSRFEGKHLRVSVHDLPAMSVQTIREGLPVLGGFRL